MRAKFVFEKFTDEDTDPIKDLGIGIYHKRSFASTQELYAFLYDAVMPALFHADPIDLVSKYKLLYFKGNVVKDLKAYINKYVENVGDQSTDIRSSYNWWYFDIPAFQQYVLKRAKKEGKPIPIMEKFTPEGDPVHHMGIGLKHRFEELIKVIKYMHLHSSVPFENLDFDRDEFTIRTNSSEFLDISDRTYRSQGRDWDEVGVYSGFDLEYYIDIILPQNKMIRSFQLTNNDIDGLDYWDTKVLCDNVLETSDEDISQMIADDYDSIDSSDAFDDGLREAYDIADADNDKTQKRIRSY